MAFLLAAVFALIELILAPGYMFYFDITPKLVVLLAGVSAALLWGAWKVLRGAVTSVTGPVRIFTGLLLLNVMSLGLSTAFSSSPGLSLFGTNWRLYGSIAQTAVCLFAILVVLVCAGRPERVKLLLRSVALAGAASAAYGIAQYAGWDPLLPAAAYHVGEGIWTIVRPPGTLGYASYFATWLLIAAFLSLALRALESSAAWRRMAAVSAVLSLAAMLLTGTRAAILGVVVAAVFWLAREGAQVRRRAAVFLGIALLAGAAFYYSPAGWPMRSRARWFSEDPWGGARRDLWRDSLRMASHRLPTGYGPEVFTAEFPNYESLQLARSYPDFAHESPHNILIDALVAQGLPGLLILLALCTVCFRSAWRLKTPLFGAALAAATVSQQLTAFTLPTAIAFFGTAAVIVALGSERRESVRSVNLRRATALGAAVVSAALIYVGFRLVAADHALALVQRDLQRSNLADAAADYRRYERLRLPGGSADIWYSRAVLGLATRSGSVPLQVAAMLESGNAARRATRTAEDPFNSWYNLAVFYAAANNGPEVERSLRAAIRANAMWFKPHWTLAQVLLLEGRRDDARREAERAAELDGGKHPEVARTLDQVHERTARTQLKSSQR